MKGQDVVLQDLASELEDIVSPINLDCEEEIETEEVEVDFPNPYEITAVCYVCEETLRIAVVTTTTGIRDLQTLLLGSLSLLCAACSRDAFCNRRPQRNGF
ncbi:E7 protein [Bos taurus papillomavirus 15]|uniref:Protein E7 n=1 Tax=Bos taurus papillomavirus 15 TaxID=1969700 RepID=A0A0B5JF71_9PAPI|nr:E7 protein [Bos taurus papillomavirus 15]